MPAAFPDLSIYFILAVLLFNAHYSGIYYIRSNVLFLIHAIMFRYCLNIIVAMVMELGKG